MTVREQLVTENKLEDMTFGAFCFIVEKETDEKITGKLVDYMRTCYDNGLSTFSKLIRDVIWTHYGRVA